MEQFKELLTEEMDKKDDKHFDDVWQMFEKLLGELNPNNPKNKNYKKEMRDVEIDVKRAQNSFHKYWVNAIKN